MKELVLSNFKKRKVQTVTLVLVVAASAMLLFALALMYSSVANGVQLSKERGGAEVMLVPDEASDQVDDSMLLFTGAPVNMYMGADVLEKAANVEGVKRVSPQFFSQTLSVSCCSTGTETRIVGFDIDSDWTVQPLTDYDLSKGLADDEVLLGSALPGKDDGTIDIVDKTYKVVGHLAETSSDIDLCIMVDISTARKMAANLGGYEHFWDKYGQPDSLVSTVLVDLDDDVSGDNRILVSRRLGNLEGARALVRSEVIDSSQESLSSVFTIMLAAGILMLVVSALQLFARFYSMAWDRKSELALYRAVGAKRGQVARLIRGEAFALVGIGVVLGLVCGFLLYLGGNAWLSGSQVFPFVMASPPTVAVWAVALAALFAVITFLSVLAPLRQIGRIDPSLAMQQSDID